MNAATEDLVPAAEVLADGLVVFGGAVDLKDEELVVRIGDPEQLVGDHGLLAAPKRTGSARLGNRERYGHGEPPRLLGAAAMGKNLLLVRRRRGHVWWLRIRAMR